MKGGRKVRAWMMASLTEESGNGTDARCSGSIGSMSLC